MDFGKLIMFQARSHASEPAVAFTGGVATYSILAAATLAATDKLRASGLGAGALVAIDVRNPFHHTVLILALNLCGMVSASVQTSFNVELSGLKPDVILVDSSANHPPGINLMPIDESWFVVDPTQPVDYARLFALPGFGDEAATIRVIFSSGTTGVPKSTGLTSAMLEHRLAHASFVQGGGGLEGLRVLCLMGFSTIGGYMATLGALAAGGVICFAQQPGEVLHVIRMFNVGLLIAAAVQLPGLLKSLGSDRPPASLRTVILGGSKIALPLLQEARAKLCSNVLFGYGSTEAGSMSNAPASQLASLEGTAGYVLPWVTLEAVDDEDRPVKPGEAGRLRVRTTEQARYVVDQPENALVFRNGWFYPGDIGTVGADGLVTITGRSAEVINYGGSIVAPDLLERVLSEHKDVTDAVAFGVPTPMGFDEIWAAVVAPDRFNEAELLHFCREKLADKAPSVIRRVGAVPRTDSGKPKRREVRDLILAARTPT
ncbi:MAG TPA: class I adenylate-forming enzyme family protein [Bauldia sp.]|nr:class I adenylate-forming enzyme family protein [Bauldia sp.]